MKAFGPQGCGKINEAGVFETECPTRLNQPETPEYQQLWSVIEASQHQLRLAPSGGVVGLDYTAIFSLSRDLRVRRGLLGEILPLIEQFILIYYSGEEIGDDDT